MSEFNAALGIIQLKYLEENISLRRSLDSTYRKYLSSYKGIRCHITPHIKHNYSYFPIFIEDDCPFSRDMLFELLRSKQINARKYFYPLISDMLPYNKLENYSNLPVASSISSKVLCLPLYPDLDIKIILDAFDSIFQSYG